MTFVYRCHIGGWQDDGAYTGERDSLITGATHPRLRPSPTSPIPGTGRVAPPADSSFRNTGDRSGNNGPEPREVSHTARKLQIGCRSPRIQVSIIRQRLLLLRTLEH